MTPLDVAADSSLRLRFQNEVAYLERIEGPMDELGEVAEDAELLASADGVRIIAWLWPHASYEPAADPFAAKSRQEHVRWTTARRFRAVFELSARAVGRSTADLKTHLAWSSTLSNYELARLYHGYDRFGFPVIVGLCNALQLEFTDAWVLKDPQVLARRIDESVLASTIADRLRNMSLEGLHTVERQISRRPAGNGMAPGERELGLYHAPKPDGRYAALYEALALDEREHPAYGLDEIDRILTHAGEAPLPPNARDDRSWWTGNGASPQGRPQVSSWWAAGYRISRVNVDASARRVSSIELDALPGRALWLANEERVAQRQYRIPETIEIYRTEDDLLLAKLAERKLTTSDFQLMPDVAKLMGILMDTANLMRATPSLAGPYHVLFRAPDDPDISDLVDFLEQAGQASRSQIEEYVKSRGEPVDPTHLTNLLTKARRQGWTVNNGTRNQPRWASTRLIPQVALEIASTLQIESPNLALGEAVPPEFLRSIAEALEITTQGSSASQIAREIIESHNQTWQPEFEAVDGSLTGMGLKAIKGVAGPQRLKRRRR